MPVRILTDAHISPTISHRLLQQGFDVICVRDRGLLRAEDWELMRWCSRHGYAICTDNEHDFEREHRAFRDRGEEHPGILLVGDWSTEEIYWALRQYLESGPDSALLVNHVHRVPAASPDFVQERSGE